MVALAAATFRACSIAGCILGFFWGAHHQPHSVCTDRGTEAELGHCFGSVMLTQFLHWGVALGSGALICMCSGLLLAKIIRGTAQLAT